MIESIFVLNGDRKSEPKNGQPSLAANEVYVGETVTERGVPPDRLTSVLPERVRVNYVTQEQENDDPNGGSFQRKRPRLDLQQNNQTFETQVMISGVGSGVNPHLSVNEAISLQRGYECPQCLTCFSISSELILHQRIHHGINHPPQPTQTQHTLQNNQRNQNHTDNHDEELIEEYVNDFMSDFDEHFVSDLVSDWIDEFLSERFRRANFYSRLFPDLPDSISQIVPDFHFKSENF